jgi:hypothetical protein
MASCFSWKADLAHRAAKGMLEVGDFLNLVLMLRIGENISRSPPYSCKLTAGMPKYQYT